MKLLIPLVLLSCVACGKNETIRSALVVSDKPPRIVGTKSKLQVPDICPIYIPGGGDKDTAEPPLPSGSTGLCAVDDQGNSYGIITGDGDLPTLPPLAILPGNHEVGIYVGIEPGWYSGEQLVLTGPSPIFEAWAAPTNIENYDCCADTHPDARIPVEVVASGDRGVLFSLGTFDLSAIQVAFIVGGSGFKADGSRFFVPDFYSRFYVNGAPKFGTNEGEIK